MTKKICLINPGKDLFPKVHDYHVPPYGILSIAGVLERSGYEVSIYDFEFISINRIKAKMTEILKQKGDGALFWGINFTAGPGLKRVFSIIKVIRNKLGKNAKIVLGGALASVAHDQIFKDLSVDIVCIGESELTALELADRFSEGSDISDVKGLVYRSNGSLIKPQPRETIGDMQVLPGYPWHKIDVYKYIYQDSLPVLYSRGCPSQCTFCNSKKILGPVSRSRSVEQVISDLIKLKDDYGIQGFKFIDTMPFGGSKRLFRDFCHRLIGLNLELKWRFYGRVDFIDKEMVPLMQRAGCYHFNFGVESGSQRIIDRLKKGITLDQVNMAIKVCHDSRVECSAIFMLGLPFETRLDLDLTRRMINRLEVIGVDTIVHVFNAYPGTEIMEDCIKAGTRLPNKIFGWARTNEFNYLRFPVKIRFLSRIKIYRLMLERSIVKRVYRFAKRQKVTKKRHPYNFPFTKNDSPELRQEISRDLDRVLRYLAKFYPDSDIGLWGSFSYGEGVTYRKGGMLVYRSDFDIIVVTNSFAKYIYSKIKGVTSIRDRLRRKETGPSLNLGVLWRPFLALSSPNAVMVERVLAGNPDIIRLSHKSINRRWMGISNIYGACSKLKKALSGKEADKYMLCKSFIECFRAYILTCRSNAEAFYSIKKIEASLHELRGSFTGKQFSVIAKMIEFKKGIEDFDYDKEDLYCMLPLFKKLLYIYNKGWSLFHLDYAVRFYSYLKRTHYKDIGFRKTLNPLKSVLNHYNSYIDAFMTSNYDFPFTLNDNAIIRDSVQKDLKRIVTYLDKKFPNSSIGLCGSFAFGEGKVRQGAQGMTYISDIDITLHTRSFLTYLIMKKKGPFEIDRYLSDAARNLYVNVTVNWSPLLLLGIAFGGIPVKILNGKESKILRSPRFALSGPVLNHIIASCVSLRGYFNERSRDPKLITKSFKDCLKAGILSDINKKRSTVRKEEFFKICSIKGLIGLLPGHRHCFNKRQHAIFDTSLLSILDNAAIHFTIDDIREIKPIYLSVLRKYKRKWTIYHLDYAIKYHLYFKNCERYKDLVNKRKGILFYLNPLYFVLKDNIQYIEKL